MRRCWNCSKYDKCVAYRLYNIGCKNCEKYKLETQRKKWFLHLLEMMVLTEAWKDYTKSFHPKEHYPRVLPEK